MHHPDAAVHVLIPPAISGGNKWDVKTLTMLHRFILGEEVHRGTMRGKEKGESGKRCHVINNHFFLV